MPHKDRRERLAYQRAYKKTPAGIAARERFNEKRRQQAKQAPPQPTTNTAAATLANTLANWSRA